MENTIHNVSWPGWETVKLIGRGSFGAVYEIRRDMLDYEEKAALKVITIPQNDSDIEELYNEGYDKNSVTNTFQAHLKSIISEYSLMRKMNGSANIVNCDDVRYVQHDDGIGWDIYIKMELLTPLAKSLPAQITDDTVIRVAKDLCHALVLCKKHGIVHRDIKPQNIFVSDNEDYKLGDFGIAKTVEKTSGGTKIGTYKYMAPEVYHNQPYGAGADIYSLGLVLYWLLNDRRMPFMPLPPEPLRAGMDEQARMRRLSGERLPPPAHGSDELKSIVLKACAYDPKDRYQSAVEMMEELNLVEHYRHIPISVQAQRAQQSMYYAPAHRATEQDDLTVGLWNAPAQPQKPAVPSSAHKQEPDPDATIGIFQSVVRPVSPPKVDIETERTYKRAKNIMETGTSEAYFKEAARLFKTVDNYKDASTLAARCLEKAETARKNSIYIKANALLNSNSESIADYENAIKLFSSIINWKDSAEKISACNKAIANLEAKILATVREQEEHTHRKEKLMRFLAIGALILILLLFIVPIISA